MDQLPNLGREQEMLSEMGMSSIDELFSDIPADIRRDTPLPLRGPQSEEEIWADAQRLLGANVSLDDRPSFLAAGLARNFVPTMVGMLATRGEFLTSYTPYQPEVSQGMLQAMWEFQTMVSELVGLPVANVSMYDASTAAAEAITCAVRVHRRKSSQKNVVYVSMFVPPQRFEVIRNYTQGSGLEIRILEHLEDGHIDMNSAAEAAGCCAVYVEQPSAFGILDPGLMDLKEVIGEETALIVGVDAVSLGIVEPPGSWGADIVVGEGQPFGIGPTAGGPIYGIFACGEGYTRQMPGRIVGLTRDVDKKRAFTLTLSTREQHIRRHRATSNICSNETLIALMGAMHMALLGPRGIERLALRVASATEATKRAVASIDGIELVDPRACNFREFAVKLPGEASDALAYLDANGVLGGFDLGVWWEGMSTCLLIGADERTSESDIEALTAGLSSWLEGAGS
uniref:Glycine dehydrogenase subunit 1 (GcvPA) n=1 Tax=uncultured marine group II/III euryarchaeote SAT1000_02_F02 TaxID=1456550 RepID=A0A075I0K5_9EURY|nr:glycine dehydrogenase subunit 1 (gcvPA) [uncultured marine group II/III euryarchaeote SAT1000_02_F02]